MASLATLSSALGFAFRRAKRLLPDGPRRAVVLEHLAVAVELVAEVQEPIPEAVRRGGLQLLARLAGDTSGGDLLRGAAKVAPGGGRDAAAVGGVSCQGGSAGSAPAIACPPPAAARFQVGLPRCRAGPPPLGGDLRGVLRDDLHGDVPAVRRGAAQVRRPRLRRSRTPKCGAAYKMVQAGPCPTAGVEAAGTGDLQPEAAPGPGAPAAIADDPFAGDLLKLLDRLQESLVLYRECLPYLPCPGRHADPVAAPEADLVLLVAQLDQVFTRCAELFRAPRGLGEVSRSDVPARAHRDVDAQPPDGHAVVRDPHHAVHPGGCPVSIGAAWVEWGTPAPLLRWIFSDAVGVGSDFVVFGGARKWSPPAWRSCLGNPLARVPS